MEPVERRFQHRLPWLLVGLAGALLAADFVGRFEGHLQETVMLAFFIPGIVYLADAVGTQTETIVVRGLSVGVTMQRVVVHWRRAPWPVHRADRAPGTAFSAGKHTAPPATTPSRLRRISVDSLGLVRYPVPGCLTKLMTQHRRPSM